MTGSSASAGACAISSMPSLPGRTRSSSTRAGRSASRMRARSRKLPVAIVSKPAPSSASRAKPSVRGAASAGRRVGAPAGDHVEEVLGGAAELAQALDDAPRLAVERDRSRRRRVEHHHADRGGVDQDFEVGAGAALVAQAAGIGDRDRGLRGEQHEQFLVVRREAGAAGLLGQPEAADVFAEVAHRRALEGAVRQQNVAVEAERAEVRRRVRPSRRVFPDRADRIGDQLLTRGSVIQQPARGVRSGHSRRRAEGLRRVTAAGRPGRSGCPRHRRTTGPGQRGGVGVGRWRRSRILDRHRGQ